ncbi:protein spaetzle isoform X2 [Bicyclus anynana]|uniref:Protein spaetzle isoform X2 n=1 Tax=Bicyclus anynana TaxID=110368 RepID=A0ABM3LNR2_BICAN|nr:protein spaetzle isoform X2 [Bicyclus anynana]
MGASRGFTLVLQFVFILLTTNSNARADRCDEFGICDHVDNYPKEIVQGLIHELKSKNTPVSYDVEDVRISSRFDDFRGELCVSRNEVVAPEKARDTNGIDRIILNDKNDPLQKFYIGTCITTNSGCHKALEFLPNYKGVCVQKTALREMYYLNEKNQTSITYFPVPTCCSCMLQRYN